MYFLNLVCLIVGYREALLRMLFNASDKDMVDFRQVFQEIVVPSALSAHCERPDIDEAVSKHIQRFCT